MSSPQSDTELSWVHAGRLRASGRELTGLIAQFRTLGRDGGNPTGRGAVYPPLPEDEWGPLAGLLERGAALAGQVAALAGPDPDALAVQSEAATRAALRARLGQWDDALRDLDPARLQERYGALPRATADELIRLHGELRALLAELRRALGA